MEPSATALITGATGGFGYHLCREFARHGYDLVITARNPNSLKQLAARLRERFDVRVQTIPLDLNQPGAARQLYDKVTQLGHPIDVLVNNAGFGLGGAFWRHPARLQNAMINVNLRVPTQLCRLFLPDMLRRDRGGILNVCSTGSFVPGPYNSVYCATKAYLLSLTEALAVELRDSPIRVSAVCPGAMDTGYARRARMESTLLYRMGVIRPEKAAEAAFAAFARGAAVAVVGRTGKATVLAARLLPRCLTATLSGIAQKWRND